MRRFSNLVGVAIPVAIAAIAITGSMGALVACGSSREKSPFDPNDPNNGSSGSSGSSGPILGGDGGQTGKCIPDKANFDIPGNDCDDDGDGTKDNPQTCDTGLASGGSAEDFAKAIGICQKASEKGYGLVSAKITRGFGSTEAGRSEQSGILPKFGSVIKPREGKMLGILSTGYAQEYDSAQLPFGGQEKTGENILGPIIKNYGKDWNHAGALPTGYPKPAAGCEQAPQIRDAINVHLEIKAPKNAGGLKFDFNFYSGEWPAYICSAFNDGFIAYLSAKGFNKGEPDNISFDKDKNPVSVNNGFFDRCTPNVDTGCATGIPNGPPMAKPGTSACPGGTSELAGTGFGIEGNWCALYSINPQGQITNPGMKSTNGGSTGWLTSQAPVQGGETFTLDFIIWDTGDGILDSSVLLDNFSWVEGDVSTGTVRPPN